MDQVDHGMSIDEPTYLEGRLIDARYELINRIWGDQPKFFNHSLLCQVNLPYTNPGDDVRVFSRSSGKVTLQLEAGYATTSAGFEPIGLPWGARARLLMLHLCTEAIKTQSPMVEVESSFTAFARSLGLSVNGKNIRSLRDQTARMGAVTMRMFRDDDDGRYTFQGLVFSGLKAEWPKHPGQRVMWPSYVNFNADFFVSLMNHAVPLRVEAIGALRNSARSLDVYCWAASRLHRVKKPMRISYTALQYQFGDPEHDVNSFKKSIKNALRKVVYVYPEARIDLVKGGILIKNSPPPVRRRTSKKLIE